MTPRISILLPVYNGARFLDKQIASIRDQSVADFELVVIDDGSVDDGMALIAKHMAVDDRITVRSSTGNVGQKSRLRELAGTVRSPLIAISDQDDVWHVDKLARLQAAIVDKGMVFGRSEIIDADGRATGQRLAEMFGPTPTDGDVLSLLFSPQVSAHAALMRREMVTDLVFARFQPFDWLLSLDAAFGDGLAYVDDAVVYHRLHGGNQMNGPMANQSSLRRRFGARSLYHLSQTTKQKRHGFVERLEHIAHSPVVGEAARRMAGQIGMLCRGAWFEPGVSVPFSNPKLRRTILNALEPFAGSPRDWRAAIANVDVMTRAQIHPATLARSVAGLLGR